MESLMKNENNKEIDLSPGEVKERIKSEQLRLLDEDGAIDFSLEKGKDDKSIFVYTGDIDDGFSRQIQMDLLD